MHNVLFYVVYINVVEEQRHYFHLYAHTRICTSGCVLRDNDVDARQRQ